MGISSFPGYSNSSCVKGSDTMLNNLEVIVKRESDSRKGSDRKWNTSWTQGVKSLVNTAIEKLREEKESSTWGGGSWDWGSSAPAREDGKSFVLTGSSSAGEHLMWKEGLKNDSAQNSRNVLVAKKEVDSSGSVVLKLGSMKWAQVYSSPQIQIQKDSLSDWEIRIEFRERVRRS